jgi:hypothetical protein
LRSRIGILALGLLLALPVSSSGGDCIDYGDYMQLIGAAEVPFQRARVVALSDNYAYVLQGRFFGDPNHLLVFDVSDAEHPSLIGSLLLPGTGMDIALVGNLAYVADDPTGILIVDISSPSSPAIVATFPLMDPPRSIAVSGNHVYAGTLSNGGFLYVVDFMNPQAPVLVGMIWFPNCTAIDDIAIEGSRAYLACGNFGLCVVDISNPSDPQFLGAGGDSNHTGLAVSGSHAFASLLRGWPPLSYFQAIDVSNPHAPHLVDEMTIPQGTGYTHDVAIVGDRAFASDQTAGIQVFDISDPTSMQHVGSLRVGSAWGLATVGDRLFVAEHWDLKVVDIANPESPRPIANLATPDYAEDVAVSGHYAYLADHEGIRVIDILNPNAPSLVGSTPTPGVPNAVAIAYHEASQSVALSSTLAYVADGPAGLQIVDVSNPAAPNVIGGVDTPSGARDVAVVSDRAYVADSFSGVKVVDVTDPTTPAIIHEIDTFRARGIAVKLPYAYIADADSGFKVINVEVAPPVLVGQVQLPGSAERVVLNGSLAYVAAAYAGIQVIDVADPQSPQVVGNIPQPASAFDVAVAGSAAYLAAWEFGVRAVDVTVPTAPLLLGSGATVGEATGITVAGDLLYISDGSSGLTIMPLQCPAIAGIGETSATPQSPRASVMVWPNPTSGPVHMRFHLPEAGQFQLGIYDVSGHLVRQLQDGRGTPGLRMQTWDGRNDRGRRVGSGVYVVRLCGPDGTATSRVTLFNR